MVIKKILFLTFISIVCIFSGCRLKQPDLSTKPNLIIILTDDQGYGDLSCHGNPILKTPAMDKLHDESIRFTDFHVSSICTPSRSQILTGKDACRNGAFAWAYSREIIHTDVPVMPEIFKDNGYATGHFGKWHLGDNYPFRPIDRGFDESIKHGGASVFQTPDYWDNDYMDDHYEHNGVMKPYKGYCTDVWFEESKKFMSKSKEAGKPFFVYLPTNAPHGPLIVEPKYSKPYLEELKKGFEQVEEFKNYKSDNSISLFFGMIANLDENLSKLDFFLKEKDLFENTILIFMTDNGGTGGLSVFNAGMRGGKGKLYEGGHRVPFFIRWPNGKFSQPKDIDILTHSQDILPTLIDMCQLKYKELELDGVSLIDLIRGKKNNIPDRFLVMQNAKAPMAKKYDATVMLKKWRLVNNNELYNLAKDPGQKLNVADENPEIVMKMKAHYEEWWNGIQEPLNRVPSIPVGGENCNNITLTCFDWHGFEGAGNVTVQPTVRQGGSANGIWNIEIIEDGNYEFRCSRWPEEANTPMVSGLPPHQTLTMTYPEGKALPIAFAEIQLNDKKELIEVNDTDLYSAVRFDLKKGKYKLKTTFFDEDQKLVCGAYYAYVKKVD